MTISNEYDPEIMAKMMKAAGDATTTAGKNAAAVASQTHKKRSSI